MNEANRSFSLTQKVKQNPAVGLLAILSFFGWLLVVFNVNFTIQYLSFQPNFGLGFFRWISPIFLHFSLIHFAFNCLWLGILGEKIENFAGSSHLLLVVLISGAASNFIQYLWSGSIYFGGMSGVVYALLGYLWVASKIVKSDLIALPPGIFGFMIGWLIFCMTPIIPFIFGSGIANAAHLGGLIIGIFLGLLFSLLKVRES